MVNVFDLTYTVHISGKKFEICMDFVLITDKNKSYVYIKDFNSFRCKRT